MQVPGARDLGGLWDSGQCAQTTTLPTFFLRLRDAHDWWYVSLGGGCPNSVIRGFESTVLSYGRSGKLEWGALCILNQNRLDANVVSY